MCLSRFAYPESEDIGPPRKRIEFSCQTQITNQPPEKKLKNKPKLYRPEKKYRADYVFWVWIGIAVIIIYGPIFLAFISLSPDKGAALFNGVMAIATIVYAVVAFLQYRNFRDNFQPIIEPTFVITAEYCFLRLKILKTSSPFVLCAVKIEPSDLFEDSLNQERVIYKNIPLIQRGNEGVTHDILLPPLKEDIDTKGVMKLVLYTSLRRSPYDFYIVPVYRSLEQMKIKN